MVIIDVSNSRIPQNQLLDIVLWSLYVHLRLHVETYLQATENID